jgi:hypothetical protein
MTPRERYIQALTFGTPDKVPFEPGHGRQSTKRRWHQEGLPQGADPLVHAAETLGIELDWPQQAQVDIGADFRLIPQFQEKVLEKRDGHLVVQDWKGNVCEISDEFDVSYLREAKDFVTRAWLKCPVESPRDWEAMKRRYDLDAPGRFPDDFAQRCRQARRRDGYMQVVFPGPFWQMREWCGFEGLCMMTIEQPQLVEEMSQFWQDFVAGMLERIFQHVVPDAIWLNEDMAYKGKSMISPAMVRRFCRPCYDRWAKLAFQAGVAVVDVDSDGCIDELIPIWIESGANACDPIEVAAGNDINEFRRRFGHKIAYRGGVDKRAMAAGGETLAAEMQRIAPVCEDGGFIPGCDHGIPHDVSWQNFLDYCRQLAEMTGWL